MSTSVQEVCRAKLNLFLDVRGRRDDGFHELVTVFHEISLADLLTVRLVDDAPGTVTLELPGRAGAPPRDVPAGDENLVVRAVRAFAAAAQLDVAVHCTLDKRIPVGAGLGGGSADAAGALRALNRLLGTPLDQAALHDVAAGIGSDVPFQLVGGAALGTGRGDVLTPVAASDGLHYVVLCPGFGISTADVYGALPPHGSLPTRPDRVLDALESGDAEGLAALTHNALAPAALRVEPRLADVVGHARRYFDARVSMSGSGAALFLPIAAGDSALAKVAAPPHDTRVVFARGVPATA